MLGSISLCNGIFISPGGYLGKTAQFWLMYSNITSIQHILHTAVQLSDFGLHLESVKQSLQMCFSYNMQNYARYVSYYVEILSSLEKSYQV